MRLASRHSQSLPPPLLPPPTQACTQPLGIEPESTSGATQSGPLAYDEGVSTGYGHNSAWYEYDPSTGLFVRVWSWYDPASDVTPIQPDEIDVTDDPELGIGSSGASAASPPRRGEESISCERGPLPTITVTATTYSGGGSLVGFLWRATMGASGSGSRAAIRGQWAEMVIDVPDADCRNDVDEMAVCASVMHWLTLRGQGLVRTPGQGQWFRFIYRDGQHQTWQGSGVNGYCVQIRQGCYRP